METLNAWWGGLTAVNQGFFVAAVFFGVFFFWQLIMALIGVSGGDHDLDAHVESTGVHESPTDAHDTAVAFKLVSVRSLLAFATLFSWAGALYLQRGVPMPRALTYALCWGLAAMFGVSLLLFLLRRLSETGTMKVSSCVGQTGTIYLDVPENGWGEIRIPCSGVMTHLRAREAQGRALKAGTAARVLKVLGPNQVEVAAPEADAGKDAAQ